MIIKSIFIETSPVVTRAAERAPYTFSSTDYIIQNSKVLKLKDELRMILSPKSK